MKALLLWVAISTALTSSLAHASALDVEQQQKIDEVSKLLEENPDVIEPLYKSLNTYISKVTQFEDIQKKSHEWLENNDALPFIGNPEGKAVLFNFTDYDCPYCKRLDPLLVKLTEDFPELKVVTVLTPLKQKGEFDKLDTNATLYALTVWEQAPEHFNEVNKYLFAKNTGHSEKSLNSIAKKTDTVNQLHATEQVRNVVKNNMDTFHELGLQGTPAMMIGDTIIPGYLPYDRLKNRLASEINAAG
ncbi:thioredoxin domain-containing protein [Vibrio makurazakiensis]|uniref:thioredoxin domain-containing protein n=1 Tax=Vibrio makurazakiensis TaxID=2910250 RepID=UPI003D0A34E7